MAENTKIEWCDHSFNGWYGCTKVSPACKNCYAEKMAKRFLNIEWGKGKPRKKTSDEYWAKPIKWNEQAQNRGIRYKVFANSMSDVFDEEVPDRWRTELFKLIKATPNLDWLILTKRIKEAQAYYKENPKCYHISNIWLGATICNQYEAYRLIPTLITIPTAKSFISIEPLLEHISLKWSWIDKSEGYREYIGKYVDWVIVGGETGAKARTINPDWVRSLKNQCQIANAPFFFKQWGKYQKGALLDGKEYKEFPKLINKGECYE